MTKKKSEKSISSTPPSDKQTPSEPPKRNFQSVVISDVMLRALQRAGYERPTPVQTGMIPLAMRGLDVMAQAQTGTGKTAAFCVPILEKLKPQAKDAGPQAIILVPTRELAVQVYGEFEKLSFGRRCRAVAVYGGKPIRNQIEKLRAAPHVIVGTPGRVLDLMGRHVLDLSTVATVVLDEADRMLDIGFRPDIEKILRACPRERQTMLLSATVPPPIERLAHKYMNQPKKLDLSPKNLSVETIEQYYFTVDQERKFPLLLRLLERENPRQAIVFCRTKRGTDRIYRGLSKKIQQVGCIHGDMVQRARDKTMEAFRAGRIRFLVATDVVGRGIDVTGISHIINYDIPEFSDDYVHRVGRTGRMGREGVAFTFVKPEEGNELTRIEQRIDRLLKRAEMDDFDMLAPVVEKTPAEIEADASRPAPPPPLPSRHTRRRRRAL